MEIMEIEAQPVPQDKSASMERRRRILTLRRDLASLQLEEAEEITRDFKELMGRYSESPTDVSEEEIVKVADKVERKATMVEQFREKRSLKMRADMQQAWQRASLSQRGKLATLYSLHRLGRGLRRIPYHSLRFCLKVLRSTARKW